MAGDLERFLRAEHARPGAELVLALAVVEPGVAAGDEQEQMLAGANRERLGDPARLDSERLRRRVDGRRAVLDLDQPEVGRMLGEPGADRFRAHSPIRCSAISRSGVLRRCSNRKMPCQVPSTSVPPCTGIDELGRGQRGAQMRGHVVRPFVVMLVAGALGRDPLEIGFEVAPRGRCGILLDRQRGRSVPAKKVNRPSRMPLFGDEIAHFIGDFVKPGRLRANREEGAWPGASMARLTSVRRIGYCQRHRRARSKAKRQKRPPCGERS